MRKLSLNPNDLPGVVTKLVDGFLKVQRPAVDANIRRVLKRHPNADPDELLIRLRYQYLNAVTGAGAGLGAVAVIPGLGTVAGLALTGGGTAVFLEASALYAQSVAAVHGITIADPERARALILTIMLGSAGVDVVRQFANQALGTGPTQQMFWAQLVSQSLPAGAVRKLSGDLQHKAIKKVATHGSKHVLGRILPFGIGAVVGAVGNRLLAKRIIASAETAFGPVPQSFHGQLR